MTGAREQGWIIAARRRDGGLPSFVKAIGTDVSAHVYWTREDADRALDELSRTCWPEGVYSVFQVEVTVGLPAP